MKIAYTIARFLLGAIFLFFGSNLFINFLHAPMPAGIMGQFASALSTSHYIYAVAFFQVQAEFAAEQLRDGGAVQL